MASDFVIRLKSPTSHQLPVPVPDTMPRFLLTLFLACYAVSTPELAFALDYVTLNENGKKVTRNGRIINRDTGGNFVLEERDGYWRVILPKDVIEQWSDDVEFEPCTRQELKKRLLAEFPKEFRVIETKRYMIVSDTTVAYATWCGNLLEQLNTTFLEHWRAKGFELSEPEFPLVAVIFADYGNFVRCTRNEVGPAVTNIRAYYNQQSNRIVFYDLTGQENHGGIRGSINQRIREIMSRPESANAVSTFVHEATHQISFNCGMFQRYAACPLWVSEGIATLYETPDFNSVKAWSSDIKINRTRLARFYRHFNERNPQEPMKTLVSSDATLLFNVSDSDTVLGAYATCWTMMHYFNAKHGDKLVEYLKIISRKKPHIPYDEEARLRDFESIFGDDWDRLHRAFFQYAGELGR